MKKFQIIEIQWLDSLSLSGWQKIDGIEPSSLPMMKHRTLGYYLDENKRSIVVFQSCRDDNKYVDGIFEIPKGCILKIKKLT